MKEVVSNSNWKAVKVGSKFMVTDEIYAILDKKNYIGEVKAVAEVVAEPEPPKAKK